MAETLYCVTDIDHGLADGTKVKFAFGDQFSPKGFSAEDIANLIQSGALSRVDPKPVEADALTAEDAALIADGSDGSTSDEGKQAEKPTK